VHVAREDLLPGGTKQRATRGFLQDAITDGATSFVYASPAPGFAQVALAYTCQRLAVECVLFCEQLGGEYHEFSLLAQSYGTTIHPCATLDVAEKEAQAYRDRTVGARKVPLGLADPVYLSHLRECLAREWVHLTQDLGFEPRRIWLPVGSATLSTTFSDVLPGHVSLLCVDVRILRSDDRRLRELAGRPRVTIYRTGEQFHQPCADEPSIPSNTHYDAKLWSLIKRHGADQDLWWNVAR
jgi:hypothetical protein